MIKKFIRHLINVRDGKEFSDFVSRNETSLTREEKTALEALAPCFENRLGWENPINEYVYRVYLMPAIPKFLYYDEYMMLPSRVSLNRLAGGSGLEDSELMAKALLLLVGIDLKMLTQSRELEFYKSELDLVQAEFTEDFLKYWSNGSQLDIEFELIREESGVRSHREIFPWIRRQLQ